MSIIESAYKIGPALRRVWRNAGVPTSAVTLAGIADIGDLCIDNTISGSSGLYQNTNTKASPTWTQITGGAVTLDGAYDTGGAGAGRTINANDGAVVIQNLETDTTNILELNKSPVGSAAGDALAITVGANGTGAGISIANAGSGNDVTGTAGWSVTKAGVGTFDSLSIGQATLVEDVVPAGTICYIGRDNTGDVTINALTGKEVHVAIAGTDVLDIGVGVEVISGGLTVTAGGIVVTAGGVEVALGGLTVTDGGADITGNSTVTGDLAVTGGLTFGGTLTISDTVTVDELILDTDGVAPANTNCYVVSDNTGDLTLNALSGKQICLAIAGADQVTLSATVLDLTDVAIDNAGYLILNAATAPGGTEVYAVNDNTGDLTLNALTAKSVNIAVAGTDEYTFSATAAGFGANNITLTTGNITLTTGYIQWSGAGYLDLGASGYIIGTGTVADAGIIRVANDTYVASSRDNGDTANVDLIKANASDLIEFGANLAALTMGGTLTLAAQQLSLSTGNITFSGAGYVAINANPAGVGSLRLANTDVIAWRNQANGGDISALQVNAADDVQLGADLQVNDNVIYGSAAAHTADTADGSLYLHSTSNAAKGFICMPDTHLGLVIGSDGSVDRATTVGTNTISLFDGTAPSGTLTNGVTLYSEGGECKVLDALGNSNTLSPHTDDGDFVIHSYSAVKDETITIHIEKLLKALAATPALQGFIKSANGLAKRPIK